MPKIVFEVSSQRSNHYDGKSGPVHQEILSLVDKSPDGFRLAHMVEYVMPDEVIEAWGGKLMDKRITLGVRKCQEWGGAIRVDGEFLEVDGKPSGVTTNGNGKAEAVEAASARK